MLILSLHSDKHHLYQQLIGLGNYVMIVSSIVTLAAVVMNFGFERNFPLTLQVAGHIATIIFATLFKIGYVIRCIGAHGLGHRSF